MIELTFVVPEMTDMERFHLFWFSEPKNLNDFSWFKIKYILKILCGSGVYSINDVDKNMELGHVSRKGLTTSGITGQADFSGAFGNQCSAKWSHRLAWQGKSERTYETVM